MIWRNVTYAVANGAWMPMNTKVLWATYSNGPIPPIVEGIDVAKLDVAVIRMETARKMLGSEKALGNLKDMPIV